MVSLIFCLGCRCLPFRCVLSIFYAWITVNLVFPVPKHLVSHRGDVGLGRMDSVCKGEWKGGKKILKPESFQSWFLIFFFSDCSWNITNKTIWKHLHAVLWPQKHCPLSFALVIVTGFFSFPLFCVSSLPDSFLVSCLFCRYAWMFILRLSKPFVCLLCTQIIHQWRRAVGGLEQTNKVSTHQKREKDE